MLALNNRKDGYRFLLPDEFIPEEINEKYADLNDAGKAADYNDVTKIIDRIADGMMCTIQPR